VKGRVAVLCSPATASGLALAGVEPVRVAPAAAIAAALERLLAPVGAAHADERPLVLLVQDDLHAAIPAAWRRRLARDPALLVVPFPSPRAAAAAAPDAYLLEILRQAIGYRVRLA
jgi:vacuolar-type H+-ATPase subunit F/Vma7